MKEIREREAQTNHKWLTIFLSTQPQKTNCQGMPLSQSLKKRTATNQPVCISLNKKEETVIIGHFSYRDECTDESQILNNTERKTGNLING